jgi:DNA-binding response OmpR family regulator
LVLAVDDEAANLMVVRAALEPLGYAIITAPNGAGGYDAATSLRPDLVVLDVMMPDESGIDLCGRLRRHPSTRSTPILLLTALEAGGHRTRALEAGADDYLEKPIDIDRLIDRVRSLLATGTRRRRQHQAGAAASSDPGETGDVALLLAAAIEIGATQRTVATAAAMGRAAGLEAAADALDARDGRVHVREFA